MAVNYVKFQRGSQTAYDLLVSNNRVDENTLYFIYPENNSTVGKLYLGNRLISGGDVVLTAASLNDLADVITEGAGANDFLVFDGSNWVAKTLNDVAALIKDSMGEIAAPANVFQVVKTAEDADDIAAINRVIPEGTLLSAGDSAIVKHLIADDLYQHTAYVYAAVEDGFAWAAMDGNYSASNVYTSSKITLAGDYGKDSRNDAITSIGNKRIGDEIAAGTSLQALLMDILSQRLQPSATNPSAGVYLTNNNNNGANVSVEIGTEYTPKYRTTFSTGSFTYGPATGCTSTAASVQVVGVDATKVEIAANALNGSNGSLKSYTVGDATSRKLRVSYGWTASTGTPKDNLGDPATNGTKIDAASGKTADSSHTITGFRNYWYGFIGTTDYTTIARDSSTNVCGDGTKNLTAGGAAISAKTLPTITAAAGDRMPVVVMPTAAGKKVSSASMPSSLNAPVTFTKLGTVNLKGLNGYGDAVSYDVWGYVADDMPVGADFSIVIA